MNHDDPKARQRLRRFTPGKPLAQGGLPGGAPLYWRRELEPLLHGWERERER